MQSATEVQDSMATAVGWFARLRTRCHDDNEAKGHISADVYENMQWHGP